MKNTRKADSFKNAFRGIKHAIVKEKNMKIHVVAALVVVFAALTLHVTRLEWLAVIFAITLVISFEMINTAVEAAVDLYIDTYHPLAKIAKDVAAGAVLVCAICAVVVGLIVFLPHIAQILY